MKLTANKEALGILIAVSSAIVFGLYPPAARAAYQDGANITFVILVATFCRMAALYLFAILNNYKIFQNFSQSKPCILAGFFQALSIIGIMAGSFFIPGGVVIVIMFSYSLMLLAFSVWRKEVSLNFVNLSATLCALLGLAFVLNITSLESTYHPLGIGLALLAAFATFVRTRIYEQQSQSRSPLVVGAESFIVAFAVLLLLLFWELPVLPESVWGLFMTALSALSLMVATFGMFYGIAFLGGYRFSMITKLEPVFTTIFGILLVGDFLTTTQYWGIAIVLLSLIALQLFDRQKR